jgi:hypothetical protein
VKICDSPLILDKSSPSTDCKKPILENTFSRILSRRHLPVPKNIVATSVYSRFHENRYQTVFLFFVWLTEWCGF